LFFNFFPNRDQHRAQLRPNAASRPTKVVEGLLAAGLTLRNLLHRPAKTAAGFHKKTLALGGVERRVTVVTMVMVQERLKEPNSGAFQMLI
jgi:hypothetical protein